jgi:hypothetical protein
MADEEYQPVPVSEAQAIAEKYGKDQVLIFAWERREGRTHITTYGTTPVYKQMAAQGGDRVADILGLEGRRIYENYLEQSDGAKDQR